MQFGESRGLFTEEQYGSRKKKSAVEHALNKWLVLDIARQNNDECIYIANDAKSCYDCILLMVAYLGMSKHGIHLLIAKCSITGLIDMEMSIRTVYGDSKQKYGGKKWKKFPHGIGQGNGYGPAIWAAISCPLLKLLFTTFLKKFKKNSNSHRGAFVGCSGADSQRRGHVGGT